MNLIEREIATLSRASAGLTLGVGQGMLPNPDPLLKAMGLDMRIYRDVIARHTHVGACVRRRTAALKAMEHQVTRGNASARVHKAVADAIGRLPYTGMAEMTVAAGLYGYQPTEVMWQPLGGLVLPSQLVCKPPEWFGFGTEGELRFRSRDAGLEGEAMPQRKFLVPRTGAGYTNPYGQPDLALCYWPMTFMVGGMKFWVRFVEKYGGAFAVGKLPRSASEEEHELLLESLDALVQDGVATIPDDGSVEIMEAAGKAASGDLFERLVMYCRSEISIALTGTNQTMEASTNRASAQQGADVSDELRDADAETLMQTVNELIGWICEVNFPGAERPVYEVWDQARRDKMRIERDKSAHAAGARFQPGYWVRAYGYQPDDLAGPAQAPAAQATAFAAAAEPEDPTADVMQALGQSAQPAWDAVVQRLAAMVEQAQTLEQLQATVATAFGGSDDLVRLMGAALALAELRGMEAAQADALPAAEGVR